MFNSTLRQRTLRKRSRIGINNNNSVSRVPGVVGNLNSLIGGSHDPKRVETTTIGNSNSNGLVIIGTQEYEETSGGNPDNDDVPIDSPSFVFHEYPISFQGLGILALKSLIRIPKIDGDVIIGNNLTVTTNTTSQKVITNVLEQQYDVSSFLYSNSTTNIYVGGANSTTWIDGAPYSGGGGGGGTLQDAYDLSSTPHITLDPGETFSVKATTTDATNMFTLQDNGGSNFFTINKQGSLGTVGKITTYDTTESTSPSTGALVVSGGVGISKKLNVSGDATFNGIVYLGNSSPTINATNTGNDIAIGTNAWAADIRLGQAMSSGQVMLGSPGQTGTINSWVKGIAQTNSLTTGALRVDGGVAVAKQLRVGHDIILHSAIADIDHESISGEISVGRTITTGKIKIGAGMTTGTVIIGQAGQTNNGLQVNSTEDSTGLGTGSFVSYGGASITKKLKVGGKVEIISTSNDQYGGALIVSGGATIAKDLYIKGGTISNKLTVAGKIINGQVVGEIDIRDDALKPQPIYMEHDTTLTNWISNIYIPPDLFGAGSAPSVINLKAGIFAADNVIIVDTGDLITPVSTIDLSAIPMTTQYDIAYSPTAAAGFARVVICGEGINSFRYCDDSTFAVWTGVSYSPGTTFRSIIHTPILNRFFCVATASNLFYASVDAITWSTTSLPATQNWECCAYSEPLDKTVVVSSTGTGRIYYNFDAGFSSVWTEATTYDATKGWLKVKWVSELSLFCALAADTFSYSVDGDVWVDIPLLTTTYTNFDYSPQTRLIGLSSSGTLEVGFINVDDFDDGDYAYNYSGLSHTNNAIIWYPPTKSFCLGSFDGFLSMVRFPKFSRDIIYRDQIQLNKRTVTQITSITTPVTINTACGRIVPFAVAVSSGVTHTMPVQSVYIKPDSIIFLTGEAAWANLSVSVTGAGTANLVIRNATGGAQNTSTLVINFMIV